MSKVKFIFSLYLISSISTLSANEEIITENKLNTTTPTQALNVIEPTYEEKVFKELKKSLNEKKEFLFTPKKTLSSYYVLNKYQAFWFDEKGIKNISLNLLETIKNDPVLKPHANNAFKLAKVVESLNNLDKNPENYISSMLEIDFMLTEIYDRYMKYLSNGTINWKKFTKELKELDKSKDIIADWEKYDVKVNTQELLKDAISQNDLNIAFSKVDFTYPKTKELITAMDNLETIALNGDYTKIPATKTLKVGEKSEIIPFLRKRLLESNDLAQNCEQEINANNLITNNVQQAQDNLNTQVVIPEEIQTIPTQVEINCEEVFDDELKDAVVSFQKSHGLTPDGVVGPTTLKFLNISAQKKVEQIRLNLERMRWLPRNLGEKYLLVNIPDYKLKMYDKGEIKLEMPVVVGEKKHPTPVFSNEMSYITLNPYWRIPPRIAQKELLPKIVKNPNYAIEKGIRVHSQWDPSSDEVDTNDINWNEYLTYIKSLEAKRKNKISEPVMASEEILSLPNLRFIQIPSDNNPLGRMKFMFPNKYSVYMHDTPAKSLFSRTTRAFSHGCIRLGKPKELLKVLSDYDTNLDFEKANEILKDIQKKDIGLKQKIPVHIVYLTSWIDEDGKLQFRDDIYRYDAMQEKYLF